MNFQNRPLPPRGTARQIPPSGARPSPSPPPAASAGPSPSRSAQPFNVQTPFLAALVDREVVVESLGGAERAGVLRRFDQFSLIVEIGGRERLVWKHAIAGLMARP